MSATPGVYAGVFAAILLVIIVVLFVCAPAKITGGVYARGLVGAVSGLAVAAAAAGSAGTARLGGGEDRLPGVPFPARIVRDSRSHAPYSVDYGLLRTTPEGLYSTILPSHAQRAAAVVRRHFPSLGRKSRVLDATANIGGDAINLAHNFPGLRVTAVECNPTNVAVLEHNVETLGFAEQIDVVAANSLTFVDRDDAGGDPYDFVYVDPPWGGPDVWKQKAAGLFLSAAGASPVPLYDFVARVFRRGVSRAVVVKAPPNFDIGGFRRGLGEEKARFTVDREVVRKGGAAGRRKGDAAIAYLLFIVRAREAPADRR